jgi:lauroyl/myristoyl acyltransferase
MSLRQGAVRWRLAPDGRPRPDAPFGRGPMAARILAKVIDGAAWTGSRLPATVAHQLATIGGNLEWALRPAKRGVLATNLAHALGAPPDSPVVRAAVRREVVNEAHRSADLLWALGRPTEFLRSLEVEGVEGAIDAARRGHGLILLGLHVGGWELAGMVPQATLPVPTTAIVADDWLAWAIEHLRRSAGLRLIYRSSPATRAARLLREGQTILLFGDDGWGAQPRTHRVRFLDAFADLPAGSVALARLCRSPIVGFAVLPLAPRRWRLVVDEPLDPPPRCGGEQAERELLQHLADRWSDLLRAHPDHWAASFVVRWASSP